MAVDWGQAQAAVIGSALIEPACVPEILAEMRPEDFSGASATIFDAIRTLSADQTPIDPVVILDKVGPAYRDTIRELIEQTPTAANVRAYIKICKDQSRLRLLQQIGMDMTSAVTLDEARESLARAAEISLDTNKQTTFSGMELAAEWISSVNEGKKTEYIETGVGCLDSLICTVPGNYHILAGYTSHGKSAMALQFAWHIAQKLRVGYFSYEMRKSEFKERLIALISGIDGRRIKAGELEPDEMQACARAAGLIFKTPIFYEDASSFTLDNIRAKVLKNRYEVIFVDYLQNVPTDKPARYAESRYLDVSKVSRGLQQLAHSLNVVVFATSQLNRSKEEYSGWLPVPELASLKESGQIEQDADAVIFVHAPLRKAMPRFRVLDVAKNRSGEIDRFFIAFDGARQHFSAPSTEEYRIWQETMHKKRMLKADEIAAMQPPPGEKPRELMAAQRNRYAAKKDGGQADG